MITDPIAKPSHKWSKIRKFIFFLCLIGLFDQLFRISFEYYSYKTKVKTHINQRKDELDLPAITICTPKGVTYLKKILRTVYPELNKTLALIDSTNTSKSLKDLYKERIYYKYVDESDAESYFKNSIKDGDFIECNLNQPTIWMIEKKWFLPYTDCSAIVPVLESKDRTYGKCFTYLSRQYSKIKAITDFQVKQTSSAILSLFISMDMFEDSIGFSDYPAYKASKSRAYLFIHQSNALPVFDPNEATEIQPGKQYDIVLSKTTKKLLSYPFDTNCFDYEKNLKTDSPKSKDQCIRHCHRDKSKQILGCLSVVPALVNDYEMRNQRIKSCNSLNKFMVSQRLWNQCIKSCKADCKQIEYHVNSRKSNHYFEKAISAQKKISTKFSLIQVRYKAMGDIEYEHEPVLRFNECVWKMFVTVMMWFGLSIFSFFAIFEMALNRAKPHLPALDDKVSPNVIPVTPQSMASAPKFVPSEIGSNMKLEHYNNFISKVVEGYPTQSVELPIKKC